MQLTTYYNLNKPEATDPYDIGNENDNMDILDSALHTHSTALGTGSSAGHNKVIDNLTKTSFANGEALAAHMGNSLGAMMAPIVVGPNYPSGITKKGDQFVYNGRLCVVTANTVSTSTAINVGSGGNASYASSITSQISDKAPLRHSWSSELGATNGYGPGNTAAYGHVMLNNTLFRDSYETAEALSSFMGFILAKLMGGAPESGPKYSQDYTQGSIFIYDNVWYVTTKAVTAGTNIITSGSNANCEYSMALTKHIKTLYGNVDTINSGISSLNSDVTTINGNISSIQSNLNALNAGYQYRSTYTVTYNVDGNTTLGTLLKRFATAVETYLSSLPNDTIARLERIKTITFCSPDSGTNWFTNTSKFNVLASRIMVPDPNSTNISIYNFRINSNSNTDLPYAMLTTFSNGTNPTVTNINSTKPAATTFEAYFSLYKKNS